MEAARAAERVKHACTIDENELLALRPTLLRGYASIQDQERSAIEPSAYDTQRVAVSFASKYVDVMQLMVRSACCL